MKKYLLLFIVLVSCVDAARDNSFTVTTKYASTPEGYFNTPHLIKARAYWEDKKIIDAFDAATKTVANQVGYAAGSQTADVFTPSDLTSARPVGVYIHINSNNSANLPSNLDPILQKHYLIGASPDNAGNSRHDPERLARVLDLVTTLKAQYNVDDSRVYVGGISGGALASIVCGMLYPETFTGIIPTEHAMSSSYWKKIYTLEEMREMASNGQRWSIILGEDSYAFNTLAPWCTEWKYEVKVDFEASPARIIYKPFFNTYNVRVAGMGHSNPSPAVFERSLIFVDAPAMRPRMETYADWEPYAFRLDDPNTVFYSHNADEVSPVAPDTTLLHDPSDDYDGDGFNNWHEYLVNSDPTVPHDTPRILDMAGKDCILHYRAGARYHQLIMHTSTDLLVWDTAGNGAQETTTTPISGGAMAYVRFTPAASSPARLFYKPVFTHNPPVNLTQLAAASATQSTTGWGGLADYGIDGNRDPDFNNNSTTHTDSTSQNWWQVDLGAEYELHQILLFNRSNNQSRLSNFRVSVLNASDVEVIGKDYYVTEGNVGTSETWVLPDGVHGQKIKIAMLGSNRAGDTILSLAEVEVLGIDTP